MNQDSFYEGLSIKYKSHSGIVKFICDEYLTMCIQANPDPLKDVCILIFHEKWKDIELINGNRANER